MAGNFLKVLFSDISKRLFSSKINSHSQYHFCANNQKTSDPGWELTPSALEPSFLVHRNGNYYSISKSVSSVSLLIHKFIEIHHADFEIFCLQN